MNRPIIITVAISLLLHLLVVLDIVLSDAPVTPSPAAPQTVDVTLIQAEPKAIPKEDNKPPPPEHNEDDPTKANNQKGLAKNKKTMKPKGAKSHRTEQKQNKQIAAKKDKPKEASNAKQLAALKNIFGEDIDVVKPTKGDAEENLNELDDSALDETLVKSPLNSDEEALRRWYNEVYKRLSAQVKLVWVKPDHSSDIFQGVIRLNLDLQGYLNSAWVHLPSGDPALDQSALLAVKSIIRYQLPESTNMARYYQNLEFRYSGG